MPQQIVPSAASSEGLTNLQAENQATSLDETQAIEQLSTVVDSKLRTTSSPLSIILSPSGAHNTARAGDTFELTITVVNQGDLEAIIELSINESATVRQWCLSPYKRIALGSSQSCEVIFHFQVPVHALPQPYAYDVVVDSPDHYPEDTPIQLAKVLQVLPQSQLVAQVEDATFAITPLTTSQQRAQLLPGGELNLTLQVVNRSNRVDRFHVTCQDLDSQWWQVYYPKAANTLGVKVNASSLPLNPDAADDIQVSIAPPPLSAAGIYTPTLQIHSDNDPTLALLSPVYFDIAPIYDIEIELEVRVKSLQRQNDDSIDSQSDRSHQKGDYQLILRNSGNTPRQLSLLVQSLSANSLNEFTCYWDGLDTLDSEPVVTKAGVALPVVVSPYSTQTVWLRVVPDSLWKGAWWGGEQWVEFAIAIEDLEQHPLPLQQIPSSMLWPARPRWHLLLALLLALGTVGMLALLVWGFILLPLRPPEVLTFATAQPRYQEAPGQPIRLQWQIRRPRQLGAIRISGQSPDGETVSEPTTYSLEDGRKSVLPAALSSYCTLNRRFLTCDNVPTDAQQVGTYQFELQLFKRKRPQSVLLTAQTEDITIAPIAPPTIDSFSSTLKNDPRLEAQLIAALNLPNTNSPTAWATQQWKISNADDIQALRITLNNSAGNAIGKSHTFDLSEGLPESLQPFCNLDRTLSCQNLPLPIPEPGTYLYQLEVVSTSLNGTSSDQKTSNQIRVEAPRPNIVSFQINQQPAEPKYLIPLDPGADAISLYLSWTVEPQKGTEVQILPTPGTVGLSGEMHYYLAQKPGTTFITLQVTSASGETLTRTVEVQIYERTEPTQTNSIPPTQPTPTSQTESDHTQQNSPRTLYENSAQPPSSPSSPIRKTTRETPAAPSIESNPEPSAPPPSEEPTPPSQRSQSQPDQPQPEQGQTEQTRPTFENLRENAGSSRNPR